MIWDAADIALADSTSDRAATIGVVILAMAGGLAVIVLTWLSIGAAFTLGSRC